MGVAIETEKLYGVLPSVVLALGMHESHYGNSELALNANNHHGIKCGAGWDPTYTYYKQDDEAQASCFRSFERKDGSYFNFASEVIMRRHYAGVWIVDRKPELWFRELRRGGYASDPAHADKLMRIVERYNLRALDDPNTREDFAVEVPVALEVLFEQELTMPRQGRASPSCPLFTGPSSKRLDINDVPGHVAQKNETALGFARRVGLPYKKILEYNDLKDGESLIEYQYMFVAPKKEAYYKEPDKVTHQVQPGETLYAISQKYGIQLAALRKMNGLTQEGWEPAPGTILRLRGKAAAPVEPKIAMPVLVPLPLDMSIAASAPEHLPPDIVPKVPERPTMRPGVPFPMADDSPVLSNPLLTEGDPLSPQAPTDEVVLPTFYQLQHNNSDAPPAEEFFLDPNDIAPYVPVIVAENVASADVTNDDITVEQTAKVYRIGTSASVEPSLPSAQVPQPSVASGHTIHIVKPGDTLYGIGRQYGVSVLAIQQANDLQQAVIRPGQPLKIPAR